MGDKGQVREGASGDKMNVYAVILKCFLDQFSGIIAVLIQSIGIILVIINGFQRPEYVWMRSFTVIILKTIHGKNPLFL